MALHATRRRVGLLVLGIVPCLLFGAGLPANPAMAQGGGGMPLSTLLSQAETLPPAELYRLAALLFAAGQRDDAVRWFYVAQLRARYHLATASGLRPDGEPALYAAFNETLGSPINE
jgi:hypothetical protein